MLTERLGHRLGVAGSADHRVTGSQGSPGDVDTKPSPGAGDEPNLLVAHVLMLLRLKRDSLLADTLSQLAIGR